MIKPLVIGKRVFPVNIIQGPLAGVSCAPFRQLTWQYSQPAFSCTEMISCKTLLYQPQIAQRRFLNKDVNEGPVCYQLAANDPIELAAAAKKVTEQGADLIDLNCGCPVKKIRRKGLGSSLLIDPLRLYQLISALKNSTHLPIAIKIRVQGGSQEQINADIAKVVAEAGADFIIVHGRHWSEGYDVQCHYDQIQFFVETLKIPVIGNGDISCCDSLRAMFKTGCAGVMISRAGVGQPWLIRQLIAEMQGKPFKTPMLSQIGDMFMTHVRKLTALLENEKFSLLQARKFAKYYGRPLIHKTAFVAEINQCVSLNDLQQICARYFFD